MNKHRIKHKLFSAHHQQAVAIQLAQRNAGGQVIVVVLPSNVEAKVQNGERGTDETGFDR